MQLLLFTVTEYLVVVEILEITMVVVPEKYHAAEVSMELILLHGVFFQTRIVDFIILSVPSVISTASPLQQQELSWLEVLLPELLALFPVTPVLQDL